MTYTIDQIEELLAKATPGPWHLGKIDVDIVQGIYGLKFEIEPGELFLTCIVQTDSGFYPPRMPDAQFITASREIIPQLLAELKAERKKNKVAVEALKKISGNWTAFGNPPNFKGLFLDITHYAQEAIAKMGVKL